MQHKSQARNFKKRFASEFTSFPHSVLTPSLCPHFLSSAPQVFYVAEDALLAITLQRVEDALPAVRQRKETTTLPRDASLFPQSVLILCRPHFALILEAERSRNRIGTLLACVCQPPSCICHLPLLCAFGPRTFLILSSF